jgi:hypothetical protein
LFKGLEIWILPVVWLYCRRSRIHHLIKTSNDLISSKPYTRGAYPLPRPPPQQKGDTISDGKTLGLNQKAQSVEDRVIALSAYRMAKGLCQKCGEKWSKTHKCAATVQLNALQEISDILDSDQGDSASLHHEETEPDHLCLALTEAAMTVMDAPRTLKIRGVIQQLGILVLIDSGSSHSFISTRT